MFSLSVEPVYGETGTCSTTELFSPGAGGPRSCTVLDQWFSNLSSSTTCPACSRCFPAPVHLFQMNVCYQASTELDNDHSLESGVGSREMSIQDSGPSGPGLYSPALRICLITGPSVDVSLTIYRSAVLNVYMKNTFTRALT